MESVHDQLVEAGSYGFISFLRKYNINGPVPESLTNYLDVRKIHHDFDQMSTIMFLILGSILW